VHFRLGLNVRHADEQLRGTIMLPHGTGREMRVAVFAEGDKAREARTRVPTSSARPTSRRRSKAGSSTSTSRSRRRTRWATSASSAGARAARPHAEPEDGHRDVRHRQGGLGRKGRQARVPHRPRRERPLPIGKKSFGERQLLENYAVVLEEIVRAKPAAAKGRYIKSITLTTTMGPGLHLDSTRVRDIADSAEAVSANEAAATV
jgi:large subunit ribosomal protein L1